MADVYKLKYYAEIEQKDGGRVRLEFHRKQKPPYGETVIPMEIGDVIQNLVLDIQGAAGSIEEPIVKTSLTLTVIDAPDYNTSTQKCGDWDEFYTSDARGWKVLLYGKSKGEQGFRSLWGGYITPDSYVETLDHHGSVSIVARDNIGLLQDIMFDGTGNGDNMITPYELITQAWERIASPMILDWRGMEDENYWLRCGGVDAINLYLNLSQFEGLSWYDAVNEVLNSLGMALRYVGNNRVFICPLRLLPLLGLTPGDIPEVVPVFEAYATRELTPAVREINERVEYNLQEGKEIALVKDADFSGSNATCSITLYGVENKQSTTEVMPLLNQSEIGWGCLSTGSIFFNPSNYKKTALEKINEEMFLVLNSSERSSWYGFNVNLLRTLSFSIERGTLITRGAGGYLRETIFVGSPKEDQLKIKAAIKLTIDRVEYWWDEEEGWTSDYVVKDYIFDEEGFINVDLSLGSLAGNTGVIQFFFLSASYKSISSYPLYIGLKNVALKRGEQKLTESNSVNTVFNEENNIIINRVPALGPTFENVSIPAFILNGIFRREGSNYVPTPEWMWPGEDEGMQLAAQVHKQLLCYYSKPNNFINGTIIGTDLTRFPAIWLWRGKEHLLMSGAYNFCTGRIEGAQLREFVRYEDLW